MVRAQGRGWVRKMRKQLKTKSDGVTRVLQSASALRRRRGLCGKAKVYDQAYAYLKKRVIGCAAIPAPSLGTSSSHVPNMIC